MSGFQRITPQQARALCAQGATLVDIRDPQSFASGHITGARHLDNHSLADFIARADFEQPLIVSCYHGNSSQGAAAYFCNQGFSQVYSLDGGFEAWSHAFPDAVSHLDPSVAAGP